MERSYAPSQIRSRTTAEECRSDGLFTVRQENTAFSNDTRQARLRSAHLPMRGVWPRGSRANAMAVIF